MILRITDRQYHCDHQRNSEGQKVSNELSGLITVPKSSMCTFTSFVPISKLDFRFGYYKIHFTDSSDPQDALTLINKSIFIFSLDTHSTKFVDEYFRYKPHLSQSSSILQ